MAPRRYHGIVVLVFVANFVSLRWLLVVSDEVPEHIPRNYEGFAQARADGRSGPESKGGER